MHVERSKTHCRLKSRLTGMRHNNTNLKRNQWAAARQDGAMGHNSSGRPWRKRKDLSMSTDATHDVQRMERQKLISCCWNPILEEEPARIWNTMPEYESWGQPESEHKKQGKSAYTKCKARSFLVVPGILSQGTYGECNESCCWKPTLQKKTMQHRGGNTGAIHEDNKALPESRGCKARRK